jgi:uncharacterized protein (DUF4415 family)
MKEKKRVVKAGKAARKVGRIHASEGKRSSSKGRGEARYLPEDLAAMYRPVKKPVTLRLDADILAWFQRGGRGYQTRINKALRQVMASERRSRG